MFWEWGVYHTDDTIIWRSICGWDTNSSRVIQMTYNGTVCQNAGWTCLHLDCVNNSNVISGGVFQVLWPVVLVVYVAFQLIKSNQINFIAMRIKSIIFHKQTQCSVQHQTETAFTLETWIRKVKEAKTPVGFMGPKTGTHIFDHMHRTKMAHMSKGSADG